MLLIAISCYRLEIKVLLTANNEYSILCPVLNETYLWQPVLFSEAHPQCCPLRLLVQEIGIPLHPEIKKKKHNFKIIRSRWPLTTS